MKIKLLVLIFLILSVNVAQAEVYMIVNNANDEIYSLSNEDDCVMPESGYTKVILKMKLKDIELQAHPTDYKYKDKKFIMNIQKISDKENTKSVLLEIYQEQEMIKNKAFKMAYDELIKEGKTFQHITVEDYE